MTDDQAQVGSGVSPLMQAAYHRDDKAVERLLDAGADPDAAQQDGFTPLDGAIQNGDAAIEALLRERGATARRRS